ncbi:arsenical-resistance protein ACR3 [Nadsonia fulvescens var. elongata DSM 6958]|uniref:Arsenical-resistance protein ACR3 n=1 Tax=Nadsonia fulvescens var. elongata DSM 6958 TaxID=857566 RepID=A0A1E3PFN2_9ASCO|nr:arsenical-resistance protein ACR3 [Nadsonia fulvescens var. elongata DSM 6958]
MELGNSTSTSNNKENIPIEANLIVNISSQTEATLQKDLEGFSASSNEEEKPERLSPLRRLGWVDRLLALWIILAMVIGIILGYFVPGTGPSLAKGQFVGVSIPIAVGLLVMMFPILCKVRYEKLHVLFTHREFLNQVLFSLFMNWIIAPLFMVGLAWAFLPDQRELREGLILVGVARCIAMVLVWTDLADGDSDYCAVLVAINSVLQIVLFAPLAIFYIKIVSHSKDEVTVSYALVSKSVAVFLGIPFGSSVLCRFGLRKVFGAHWYDEKFLPLLSPWSLLGLIFTILILFASQGKRVIEQIIAVVRVGAPLIVYFTVIFCLSFFICYKLGFSYPLSVTQSFTAASNNFELAIAVAVASYGISSDQALASTVGPLIEVPVLLSLVYAARFIYERWWAK